jgi:hypothetical protein
MVYGCSHKVFIFGLSYLYDCGRAAGYETLNTNHIVFIRTGQVNRLYRLLQTIFLLFFCFLGTAALSALPAQKILFPGDRAYEILAALSLEQGKVFFSDSSLTVSQVEKILGEIDDEALSPSGRLLYDELREYLKSSPWLNWEYDAFSGGLDLIFQPELYYKTAEETPWIYDGHSRNSLALIPMGFSLGPYISLEMELYAGQNEYAATLHDNYINIPLDPVSQFDIHFPKRAYLSTGYPFGKASGVNFAMGVGDDFFGRTRTGSVILSEYLERIVYAQLSFYSPVFKYTAEVMQYEVNKYQYMHYLQIRPHRKISLSLAEGVMVNAPLELRFLNPLTVFHGYEAYKTYDDYNEELDVEPSDLNTTPPKYTAIDPSGGSRIGSYFGAKIEFQPLRFFRFYGLFAMDQFQLPIEESNWKESLTPNAMAFQAGFEAALPAFGRGYWRFGLEGVYVQPYMYVLWDKKWSFYKEVPEVDQIDLRYWTGTPFGPDSLAGAFWLGYEDIPSRWSWELGFVFSAQGKRSGLDIFDSNGYRPTHKVYDVTVPPTGTPIYTYTVKALGSWSPVRWADLAIQPGYRIVDNYAHIPGDKKQGFEIAFSARFRPGAIK